MRPKRTPRQIKKVGKEIKKVQTEFLKTLTGLITSAFGLVAALAWNKAITEVINKYLNPGEGIISWILYALLVTFIAVIVTVYLGRLAEKYKEAEEKK